MNFSQLGWYQRLVIRLQSSNGTSFLISHPRILHAGFEGFVTSQLQEQRKESHTRLCCRAGTSHTQPPQFVTHVTEKTPKIVLDWVLPNH